MRWAARYARRLPKTWERSAAFCLVQPELWVYRRMRFHINKHPPRRHLTTEDQEAGLIQRWPSPLTTRAELGWMLFRHLLPSWFATWWAIRLLTCPRWLLLPSPKGYPWCGPPVIYRAMSLVTHRQEVPRMLPQRVGK